MAAIPRVASVLPKREEGKNFACAQELQGLVSITKLFFNPIPNNCKGMTDCMEGHLQKKVRLDLQKTEEPLPAEQEEVWSLIDKTKKYSTTLDLLQKTQQNGATTKSEAQQNARVNKCRALLMFAAQISLFALAFLFGTHAMATYTSLFGVLGLAFSIYAAASGLNSEYFSTLDEYQAHMLFLTGTLGIGTVFPLIGAFLQEIPSQDLAVEQEAEVREAILACKNHINVIENAIKHHQKNISEKSLTILDANIEQNRNNLHAMRPTISLFYQAADGAAPEDRGDSVAMYVFLTCLKQFLSTYQQPTTP